MISRKLLLALLLLAYKQAIACEGNTFPVPLGILGKNAYSKEINYGNYLAVIDRPPSPDADLVVGSDAMESRFIVDRNRSFFNITLTDGVVSGLTVTDRCLATAQGIHVGDMLSDLLVAYPIDQFEYKNNLHTFSGVRIKEGQIWRAFFFDDVSDRVKGKVDLSNNAIQSLKITFFTVGDE